MTTVTYSTHGHSHTHTYTNDLEAFENASAAIAAGIMAHIKEGK